MILNKEGFLSYFQADSLSPGWMARLSLTPIFYALQAAFLPVAQRTPFAVHLSASLPVAPHLMTQVSLLGTGASQKRIAGVQAY